MIYYMHIWKDEQRKIDFVEEQFLKSSWEDAKEQFELTRDSFNIQYLETHLIDTEAGTCKVLDMQHEIFQEDEVAQRHYWEEFKADDRRKYAEI